VEKHHAVGALLAFFGNYKTPASLKYCTLHHENSRFKRIAIRFPMMYLRMSDTWLFSKREAFWRMALKT